MEDTAWYVDVGLDVAKLLGAFQAFFREHSEHWVRRFDYQEARPQLLLQAFPQRIVKGGGRIEREYGLRRGRADLLILWAQGGRPRKFVVESKVLHKSLERTIRDGLVQTAAYMDRCAAEVGHLVIFDRDEERRWEEKVFHRRETIEGVGIDVWGDVIGGGQSASPSWCGVEDRACTQSNAEDLRHLDERKLPR